MAQKCFFLLFALFYLKLNHIALGALYDPPLLIPRDTILDNPNRTKITLSPDGKYLGYLAPLGGVMNIWIQELEPADGGEAQPKPLTFDTGRGINSFEWTYLPGVLLYSQDKNGDENWRLYKLDAASATSQTVSDIAGVQASIIAASPELPDIVFIGMNNRNPAFPDIHKLNLKTGERTPFLQNDMFKSFYFDKDLNLRLASRVGQDGGTEYLEPIKNDYGQVKDWKPYRTVSMDDDYTTAVVGFDQSKTQLYWSEGVNKDLAALVLKNFSDPDGQGQVIYAPKRADFQGVLAHPVTDVPLALYENYMKPELHILDPSIANDFSILQQSVPNKVPYVIDSSNDFNKWLIKFGADNALSEYYIYNRTNNNLKFLFKSRQDMDQYNFTSVHPIEIKTRDGLKEVCYLSLPLEADPTGSGVPVNPVPMVLWVHGGPWARENWEFNPMAQYITNRGYGYLSCNFRGSTGYGKFFFSASFGEWGRKMQYDLMDAVQWAIDNKIADPQKIAIMGGSYGGYASLTGLTENPNTFACGVDIVGPSNLITLIEATPPFWMALYKMITERIGASPQTDLGRQFLMSRSPLFYANRINKPLLIASGANDPRVRVSESDQIVQALRLNGIPVTYLMFPDEGHGFVRPANNQAFNAVTEHFLKSCLGGRAEPVKDEFSKSSMRVMTPGNLNFQTMF